MTGYRDETETLRGELRRTSAELARVNAELMKRESDEIEVIQWREHGVVAEWVAASLVVLGSAVILAGIAAVGSLSNGYTRSAAVFGGGAAVCFALMVYIAFRALPRVKVKR